MKIPSHSKPIWGEMSRASTRKWSKGLQFFLVFAALVTASAASIAQSVDTPRPIAAHDSVFIEELTWMEVRDAIKSGAQRVIVPTGGIEQNGPYVALGKHNFILELTSEAIARQLGNTLVAPIVKFVPEGSLEKPDGHLLYPGTISVSEETFERLLSDICESLRIAGFREIFLIGDSGGNQEGMAHVAFKLNSRWDTQVVRAHFIPEYYNYQEIYQWLKDRGISESSEGIHDDIAFTSQVAVRDPKLIRMEERRAVGKFTLNGIPLDPIVTTQELGREIIKIRTSRTVAAMESSLARPRERVGGVWNWLFGR